MESDPQPFPNNKVAADFDEARSIGVLRAPRSNVEYKKQSQCWDTAWSPDSKLFAWSCGRRQVKIVRTEDIANGVLPEDCLTIDCWQTVKALEFADLEQCRNCAQAPTGRDYRTLRWEEHCLVLIVGLQQGRIRVVDVETGSILLELLDHSDHVSHLQFIPDQNLTLASASYDGTIKFWDLADDGNMRASVRPADYLGSRGGRHKVLCVAASPDTQRLASAGTFKTVVILDMGSLEVVQKLSGHANHVNSCEFGPDGVLLITASADTTAIVWNSHSGQIIFKLMHQYPEPPEWFPGEDDTNVLKGRFTSNGLGAASVANDGYVRFWDFSRDMSPSAVCRLVDPLCCSFNPTGDQLAVGTARGDVKVLATAGRARSLAILCRTVVNKTEFTGYSKIDELLIPTSLKRFLKYEDIDL